MENVDYKALKKAGFMKQVQEDHFSMRLRVVGGQVTVTQLAKINEVADRYGKGYIHLTSRQGIEIPYIRMEDIEAVVDELAKADISTANCGPGVRTITACQGSAVCPGGLIDTATLAKELNEKVGSRDLPHKFKLGITGCRNNCLKAEENDLGFKGGMKPEWASEKCVYCGLCEANCRGKAIKVSKAARQLEFQPENCLFCGKCVKACKVEAWQGKCGYIVYAGGLFGNRIASGRQLLPIIFAKEELFSIVNKTLDFFNKYGRPGERFRNTLDRVGWDLLAEELGIKNDVI